jgi:hypothetical protein
MIEKPARIDNFVYELVSETALSMVLAVMFFKLGLGT